MIKSKTLRIITDILTNLVKQNISDYKIDVFYQSYTAQLYHHVLLKNPFI